MLHVDIVYLVCRRQKTSMLFWDAYVVQAHDKEIVTFNKADLFQIAQENFTSDEYFAVIM